jgi:hypothetical protein
MSESQAEVESWVAQLSSDDRKMLEAIVAEYPPALQYLGDMMSQGFTPQTVTELTHELLQSDLANDFAKPGRLLREWIEDGKDLPLAHYKRMAEIAGLDLEQLLNEV